VRREGAIAIAQQMGMTQVQQPQEGE
jgi:hypothetical protein